jgi:DnaJ-class molecular chaperone
MFVKIKMAQQQLPDFNQIMKIAQQVASQIEAPQELKSGKKLSEKEMSNAISKITKSVTDVVNPEMLSGAMSSKKQGKMKMPPTPLPPQESKISFDFSENQPPVKKEKTKRIVEIDSDDSDDNDPIAPRTKDMAFTLSVSLDDLYNGVKKKLAIRRQKIDADGSYEEEKKKLSIKIEPGMIDEQTIRFNHMADEKQGYETGDVVVTLDVEEHAEFVRDGNNLITGKEISLSEAYNPVVYIKHLNGKILKVTGDPFDIFGADDDMLKKITGMGMPVLGSPGKYGDLFIRFTCVNKTKITPEIINELTKMFPPLLSKPEYDENETELVETQFEMVTETDLELLDDSDSDSDYSEEDSDSDDYSEEDEK